MRGLGRGKQVVTTQENLVLKIYEVRGKGRDMQAKSAIILT